MRHPTYSLLLASVASLRLDPTLLATSPHCRRVRAVQCSNNLEDAGNGNAAKKPKKAGFFGLASGVSRDDVLADFASEPTPVEGMLGDPPRSAPSFLLCSNNVASFPSISIGAGTKATWGRATSMPPGSTMHQILVAARISKIHCTAY